MRKIGLLSIILANLFLITACSSVTTTLKASNAFNNEEYVASSQLILDYLEKNKQHPAPKKMVNLLNKNIQQLQKKITSLPTTDYDNKIKTYQELRQITIACNNVPPTQSMKIITPPLNLIDISLAEQYYLQGNAIIPQETIDYLTKANRYKEGLKYYHYKDMKKQMEENLLTYNTRLAEEHYQKALTNLNAKNYEMACKELEQIIAVYKPYGNYKDSQQLFDKYDPIWRKNRAEQLYNQAQTLAKAANATNEYKQLYDLYENAYQIYSRYGMYKNAKELSKQYHHQWRQALANDYYKEAIRYANLKTKKDYRQAADYYQLAFESYQEYGSFKDSQSQSIAMAQKGIITISFNKYPSSKPEEHVINTFKTFFDEAPFRVTTTTGDLDFRINLITKEEEIDKVISEKAFSIPPDYDYKEVQTLKQRTYIIMGYANLNYRAQKEITIKKISSVLHTEYIGIYPKKLRDEYECDNCTLNSTKSFTTLEEEALTELDQELTTYYFQGIKNSALNDL